MDPSIPLYEGKSVNTLKTTITIMSKIHQALLSLPQHVPPSVILALAFLCYLVLVRLLRHKRSRWIQRKHVDLINESAAQMTVDEAYNITMQLATLEFPSMFVYAIRLGMFESYAIPSITALLCRTGHFENAETASLRAANTGALLTEIFFHPPGSDRGVTATTRTNFLHSGYRKNGSITNEDMLYTLALTILEPIQWINRYEWRQLTALELNALAVYWKRLGENLHITYDELQSTSWQDGRHWLKELQEWMEQYEENNMRLVETNRQVARHVLSALTITPKLVLPAILSESRRKAMDLPKPSMAVQRIIPALLKVRRFIVRHLCLPRVKPVSMTGEQSTSGGHYWALNWSTHPWYMKATIWSRYGPSAWIKRLLNQPCPGDNGDKYHPEGYAPDQIGPAALRGKGHEFMHHEKVRLGELGMKTCPFLAARQ